MQCTQYAILGVLTSKALCLISVPLAVITKKKNPLILFTDYIYDLHMILIANRQFYPKQHYRLFLIIRMVFALVTHEPTVYINVSL